jgi:hypothetical protein
MNLPILLKAYSHEGSRDAMVQEIESIHNISTWELMDLPDGKQPLGTKWVFGGFNW